MDSAQLARVYDFSGRTIVVTGGTGILGREMACTLLGCGATVAILGRDMDAAQHVLELMGPRAEQAMAVQADVVNQDSLLKASETVKARFGTIYGLLSARPPQFTHR
jgi:NAD(P)-dependent dehydrogenase (short-subunit alcohol dehydrogenase family)